MKQPHYLKKHNPNYSLIYNNDLCDINLLFVMYMKQIVIIIMHAATNRGWHLTLNVYYWSFKSLNWIVHMILLILGEIWSKGSKLTSLFLIDVFAEVAKVNTKALNIKSYQPQQKHCRGSAEAKCIFIYLPWHFICHSKKCWNLRADCYIIQSMKWAIPENIQTGGIENIIFWKKTLKF